MLAGVLAVSCSIATVGCDGYGQGYGPVAQPPVVAVQGIRVTPQSIHFGTRGETQQLTVAVTPVNATDPVLVWESGDTTVATVNAMGLVTASAAGTGILITVHTQDRRFESSSNVSVER